MKTFVWSDGFGANGVSPWLTVVNHSGETATAEIRMKLDAGGPMVTWHVNVAPWERKAMDLTSRVNGSHFWLSVKLDKPGGATLRIWAAGYSFPPYAPVPAVF